MNCKKFTLIFINELLRALLKWIFKIVLIFSMWLQLRSLHLDMENLPFSQSLLPFPLIPKSPLPFYGHGPLWGTFTWFSPNTMAITLPRILHHLVLRTTMCRSYLCTITATPYAPPLQLLVHRCHLPNCHRLVHTTLPFRPPRFVFLTNLNNSSFWLIWKTRPSKCYLSKRVCVFDRFEQLAWASFKKLCS